MAMKKQKSLLLQQLLYGTKNGGADICIQSKRYRISGTLYNVSLKFTKKTAIDR